MPITCRDPPRLSQRAIPGTVWQYLAARCSRRHQPEIPCYGRISGSSTARYTLITVSGTRTSLSGWLARMGFADVPRAERELAALGIAGGDHPLLGTAVSASHSTYSGPTCSKVTIIPNIN